MKNIFLSAIAALSILEGSAQEPAVPHAITEEFNDSSLHNFRYGSTGLKIPSKYTVGAASPTEPLTKILSFKIDPADSAGPGRGPEIISNEYTHFGTYSARLKVPDTRKLQPDAGAVVGYFTYHMDSLAGLSEIDHNVSFHFAGMSSTLKLRMRLYTLSIQSIRCQTQVHCMPWHFQLSQHSLLSGPFHHLLSLATQKLH